MKEVSPATKLVVVGDTMIPFVLCDEHAEAMISMINEDVQYSVHPLTKDAEDAHLCQACHLHEASNPPQLILPGEF